MKISYNWLKNYIDVEVNPENISELLTDSGLEIDGMQKIQTIKGGLEGLVVGEVLTKEGLGKDYELAIPLQDNHYSAHDLNEPINIKSKIKVGGPVLK